MIEYPSRTTPDHQMNFKTYLVEIICLNMNPKLQPHFWRINVGGEYWSKKFGREISVGYKRLQKAIGDIENKDEQLVLIATIKHTKIKTLLSQKNIQKIVKRFPIERKNQKYKIQKIQEETIIITVDKEEYMRQNTKPTIPTRNKLLDEDEQHG